MDRPPAERFDVQTSTVQLPDVSSTTPYVSFTVPACVTEIAYVIDGAAGGASRKSGTPQRAEGGVGAVRSGTLNVTAGEQLRLYPAQQGISALATSDTGDAGGGGAIGFRSGGGGTGQDDGWLNRQNPGGGGGASSAISLGTTPLVVAAGGGGAGGSAWNSATNTARGGAGDMPGSAGVSHAGSGGLLNAVASGAGGKATEPFGNGGGGGGGGAGYIGGGGGGKGTSLASQGGGGGAGGTSYVDASRIGASDVADFGLTPGDLAPTGNGAVKIAWFDCASVLSLNGTATTSAGTTLPASGWEHTVTTAASLHPGSNLTLDDAGRSDVTLRGFADASASIPVTVSQVPREGWILRNWTETATDTPVATCTKNGDPDTQIPIAPVDSHSFRLDIPADSWVSCDFDSVEAAPDMTVRPDSTNLLNGELHPQSVKSGTDVEFGYTVNNTGNVPLNLTATDPKTPSLTCASSTLLPEAETRCAGITSITRD